MDQVILNIFNEELLPLLTKLVQNKGFKSILKDVKKKKDVQQTCIHKYNKIIKKTVLGFIKFKDFSSLIMEVSSIAHFLLWSSVNFIGKYIVLL